MVMSLLELMKANPLPFAVLLGIEFVNAAPDAVEARMVVRPDLCTLGGFAHGGAIMSFSDTLGGAAAFVNLPADAKARRRSRARPTSSPARQLARR
jgi:1,4-dihydroxy-2-naphthoyl-CoA hydrolase